MQHYTAPVIHFHNIDPSKLLVGVVITRTPCRLPLKGQGINYVELKCCSPQYVAKLSEKLKSTFLPFPLHLLDTDL
jgi:hypothetical protein